MRYVGLLVLSLATLLTGITGITGTARAADPAPRLRELAHGWQVLSVAYSPDGRWLASGGADRTARLWDARTGKLERALPAEC